jgi:hypothetical protein
MAIDLSVKTESEFYPLIAFLSKSIKTEAGEKYKEIFVCDLRYRTVFMLLGQIPYFPPIENIEKNETSRYKHTLYFNEKTLGVLYTNTSEKDNGPFSSSYEWFCTYN